MVSPKQLEVNKNKILDWLKEDKYSFTELDKNPDMVAWAIVVGNNNVNYSPPIWSRNVIYSRSNIFNYKMG